MFQGITNATVGDILTKIRPRLPKGHMVAVMDRHSFTPVAAGAVEDDKPFEDVLNRHVWLAYYNEDGMGIEGGFDGIPTEVICIDENQMQG